ncbi:MAG: mismatch-specific DNA-glycosylase [Mycobacterium leprae]
MSGASLKGDLGLPPLPDYLAQELRILFIGFNPGERSAQLGHYYAHPSNRFWWLLWQAGLTDRLLSPQEDAALLQYGFGLTDLVDRPSKSSGDLAGWEMRSGCEQLLDKIRRFQPYIACYNGKGVYAGASGLKQFDYGLQPGRLVAGTIDFVAASPSGRSREKLTDKLALYRELRNLIAIE